MSEVENIHWPVPDEAMQQVFNFLKIRVPWAEVRNAVENWSNVYKHENLRLLTLEDLMHFNDIFYFGDNDITFDTCKNRLIDWISKHKEFYNDDPSVVYGRMVEARNQANARYRVEFPYINWIPEYGGMIRRFQSCPENKWHKEKNIPFFLAKQNAGR